jgi:hypothetical protein
VTAPEPFTGFRACAHGLAADQVRLHRDDPNGAAYIHLDDGSVISIRVQLRPHAAGDPGTHAAALERDRQGLRRLAAVATQLAQEIEQIQRGTP